MKWNTPKGIVLLFTCTMLVTVDLSKSEKSAKEKPRPGEDKDPAHINIHDNALVMKNGVVSNKENYEENEKLLEKEEMKETKGEEAEADLPPITEDATSDDDNQNQGNKLLEKEEMKETKGEEAEADLPPITEDATSDDDNQNQGNETSSFEKRFIYDDGRRKWDKSIVPYVFSGSLKSGPIIQIKNAIALYEYWTCLRFPEWNDTTKSTYGLNHNNYLIFVNGRGCWSYVGNINHWNGQKISCCGGMVCVHEIGHSLGLYHEQYHPTRDMYLRVNPENINPSYLSQYKKGPRDNRKYPKDVPYNANSVMHYQFGSFRKRGKKGDTMTVFNPRLRYLIPSRDANQFYMFQEVSEVYRCKELKCPNFSMKCENGGYVAYINNTCRCRCVKGLDHTTGCTTLSRENKLEQTAQWPESKFGILRAANASCPNGAKEGSITHTSDGGWTIANYKAMGDHNTHHFCTFDHEDRTAKANEWPVGEYCISRVGGKCPEGGCRPGWTYNNNNKHCYKLFPNKVRSYAKASAFCKQYQAYIVNIKDKAENDYVNSIRRGTILLGMTDTKKEGTWVWEDGTEASYTNWRSNQPDNWYNEDCATMTHYGKWNDLDCNYWFWVMCEQSTPEFQEGFMEFEDESITKTGDLPDVISGDKTKLEFCCRQDGNRADPIILPTGSKFILWQMNEKGCQAVKDTIAFSNFFAHRMKTGKNVTRSGTTALSYVKDNVGYAYFCVYQPISKDCGEIIELTDSSPEKNVMSPYYPHSYHANMECAYLIKSPPNTYIVLNFDTFEIPSFSEACEDSLEIRFGLPEQPGVKYCGDRFKSTVYSTVNYIAMYLNSNSFQKGKRFKAIATLIKDDDFCYYPKDYGLTYRGKVSYTQGFKNCLPWSNVTNCVHSPNNPEDLYNDLSENYCRNPKSGSAPWCYTDAVLCTRDYCDVCGFGECYDVLDTCDEIIKANSDYCSNPSKWDGNVGCAKSCGLCDMQSKNKYFEVICSSPNPALNATPVIESVTSTHVGKSIQYKYTTNDYNTYSLKCLGDGTFTEMKDCPDGWTLDSAKQKCNKAIIKVFLGKFNGGKLCEKYGGYPAVIEDEEEQKLVHLIVKNANRDMLIGLDDTSKEGTFKWSNGKTMIYRHFAPGEPNNWRNREDCVVMKSNGYWNDISCNRHFKGIVCQIDIPVSTCKDGTLNCEKFRKVKDVAYGKQATQSSNYHRYRYQAKNALNDRLSMGSCTLTKYETDPWWKVDLQSVYEIKKVVLVNRRECCGRRLKNIVVTVGVTEDKMEQCARYDGPGSTGEVIELQCYSPEYGKYVQVQLEGKGYLILCQVKVYAYT